MPVRTQYWRCSCDQPPHRGHTLALPDAKGGRASAGPGVLESAWPGDGETSPPTSRLWNPSERIGAPPRGHPRARARRARCGTVLRHAGRRNIFTSTRRRGARMRRSEDGPWPVHHRLCLPCRDVASWPRLAARTLVEQIRKAELPPGSRLPSENQLASMLQVGRSTIREALNGLALVGMIEIRHGQGALVASRSISEDSDFEAMTTRSRARCRAWRDD